jgi:hypothetical protein
VDRGIVMKENPMLKSLPVVVLAATLGGTSFAYAAALVPVQIRVVVAGTFRVSCGFTEAEFALSPTVEWTVPPGCGSGSGTSETSVETGGVLDLLADFRTD